MIHFSSLPLRIFFKAFFFFSVLFFCWLESANEKCIPENSRMHPKWLPNALGPELNESRMEKNEIAEQSKKDNKNIIIYFFARAPELKMVSAISYYLCSASEARGAVGLVFGTLLIKSEAGCGARPEVWAEFAFSQPAVPRLRPGGE